MSLRFDSTTHVRNRVARALTCLALAAVALVPAARASAQTSTGSVRGYVRGTDGQPVPDDMAVAGFDDIPLARYMNPPLSTVHVDISQLGERAAGLLLASLQESNHSHQQLELSTTLVIRASCGGLVS